MVHLNRNHQQTDNKCSPWTPHTLYSSGLLDQSSFCVVWRLAATHVSLFDPGFSNPIREQCIRHPPDNNFLPSLEASNSVIVRPAVRLLSSCCSCSPLNWSSDSGSSSGSSSGSGFSSLLGAQMGDQTLVLSHQTVDKTFMLLSADTRPGRSCTGQKNLQSMKAERSRSWALTGWHMTWSIKATKH